VNPSRNFPKTSVEVTDSEFNSLAGLGDSPRKNQMYTELFFEEMKKKTSEEGKMKRKADAYFLVAVRHIGSGLRHEAIPNLLGRVLSGNKCGVRHMRRRG
jgi:hypothetical protein